MIKIKVESTCKKDNAAADRISSNILSLLLEHDITVNYENITPRVSDSDYYVIQHDYDSNDLTKVNRFRKVDIKYVPSKRKSKVRKSVRST